MNGQDKYNNLNSSQWLRHVQLRQELGISRAKYCTERNIKDYQLRYWEHKFKVQEDKLDLVPIKLAFTNNTPIKSGNNKTLCKFKFRNNVELKVYDINVLSAIIMALK